jgi:hypothetical protein
MRRSKEVFGLLLVAVMAVGLTAGVAASAAGSPTAVAAKKKCKKKKAHSARKKKKCKKPTSTSPSPAPTSGPLVRATLTWSNGSGPQDLDLYVFDAGGSRAGNGSDAIPNSTLSSDVTGTSGTETFTDLVPSPARALSFGVCVLGPLSGVGFTVTYVTADGATHTDTQPAASLQHYEYPNGPAIPNNYCGFV